MMEQAAIEQAFQASLQDSPFPAWFNAYREQAYQRYCAASLPARHDEAWRYAPVKRLLTASENNGAASAVFESEQVVCLTQGGLAQSFDFASGLRVLTISDAVTQGLITEALLAKKFTEIEGQAIDSAYAWLNLAFMQQGAMIHVVENQADAALLTLQQTVNNDVFGSVLFVQVESGAKLKLFEHYHQSALFNQLVLIDLAKHAQLSHDHYAGAEHSLRLNKLSLVSQQEHARYQTCRYHVASEFLRDQIQVDMRGEQAYAELNGFNLAASAHYGDTTIQINHYHADTHSKQRYHAIAHEQAVVSFSGSVYVAPDAQQIQAEQSSKNLLLSDKASVYTRPNLEIYADDVSCSHGATVGQLDQDAIFYFQSRGISKAQAQHLLLQAFSDEIVESMAEPNVSTWVQQQVADRLQLEEVA